MSSFLAVWAIAALVILVFAALVGRGATQQYKGVLIDSRGRYSLTHFQVVGWTILILSGFIAALVASCFDISKAALSADVLKLMGIAAGSAVLSSGVKAVKDAPNSSAVVAREGTKLPEVGKLPATPVSAKFSQIWLEEEGEFADRVVSVTKFQNFIITLVALALFISLALKGGGLPATLPEDFLILLGISHVGYLGGKVPDKK